MRRDELTACSRGLNSCPLPLQSQWLLLGRCQSLAILLISCSIIRNWEHPFICAHTSTHPTLQMCPQPLGVEFRQSCLDLDKWGRKVEGEHDKRVDSSLPVLGQKRGNRLSYSGKRVSRPDCKAAQHVNYKHPRSVTSLQYVPLSLQPKQTNANQTNEMKNSANYNKMKVLTPVVLVVLLLSHRAFSVFRGT